MIEKLKVDYDFMSEYVEEGVQNFYQYWERASVGDSVPHRNSEANRLYPKVVEIWNSL